MIIFSYFIGAVALILGMVYLYLKVIPKKFDGTFSNKYLQLLHDYFNFKKLYIESVIKFIFTLLTVACIALGIASLLATFFNTFEMIGFVFKYDYSFTLVLGTFFGGVLGSLSIVVVAPILLRLIYEGTMMFILLVKNVIEINNKTKSNNANE